MYFLESDDPMEEEIEYWRRLAAASSRDSSTLRNVEYIVKHLVEYLAKSLQDLQQTTPRDAPEVLETVDLQLTELWKQKESSTKPFPEERMRNLFGVFGKFLSGHSINHSMSQSIHQLVNRSISRSINRLSGRYVIAF